LTNRLIDFHCRPLTGISQELSCVIARQDLPKRVSFVIKSAPDFGVGDPPIDLPILTLLTW
jgi:hypothetical protein